MKILLILNIIFLINSGIIFAQNNSKTVFRSQLVEQNENKTEPVNGARVYFDTDPKNGAITDSLGNIELWYQEPKPNKIVVEYLGFSPDTLELPSESFNVFTQLVLKRNVELKTVEITARSGGTIISSIDPRKVEILTREEFTKAACCNLSESFETNASVDVSFSDAVTGIREVQLLGISGAYTQITKGNQATVRGLGRSYGFNYMPGVWINSVQIIKGTGSVVNGYESIAGQINVEYLPPDKMEKLIVNLYGNHIGRTEANVVGSHKFSDKLATGIFTHASQMNNKMDRNNDSFIDIPNYQQFNIANHWQYDSKKGFEGQFGGQFVSDNITGGEVNFQESKDKFTKNAYGMRVKTTRGELYTKTGYVFKNHHNSSVGLQLMGIYHQQNSYYGIRPYDGKELNFNANLIFNTEIGEQHKHDLKLGVSYLYDKITEKIDTLHQERSESVPGVFTEYTYKPNSRWTLVGGIRVDKHNLFGTFFTPRANIRWAITEHLTLRLAGGRGFRVANIFIENPNLLTSSRNVIVKEHLRPEIAWNYGISLTQKVDIWEKEATLSIDLFRTDFENQIVVDLDQSPQSALVYNLKGRSFANVIQVQWNQEIFDKFFIRLAYKYYDVRTTYNGVLLERWLVNQHRAFSNFAYEWKKFKFDYTLTWHGPKRLPNTQANPEEYRQAEYSPSFFMMNAQVSYNIKKWEIYVGGENLGNFTQRSPLIAPDQPFSPYFDTSFVWGPIYGSIYYIGLKWRIE